MGKAYPELSSNLKKIETVIKAEEKQFLVTLDQGMKILNKYLQDMDGSTINGELVFKLYDTYGFPIDLTEDIAREKGYIIDKDGYDKFMAIQKTKAKTSSNFKKSVNKLNLNSISNKTSFKGYDSLQNQGKILGLYVEGESVSMVDKSQEAIVILDNTTLYAESGGQVGDRGRLYSENSKFD